MIMERRGYSDFFFCIYLYIHICISDIYDFYMSVTFRCVSSE